MPGAGWYKAFLKRHPSIRLRTPEAVTPASAAVGEADIKSWFKKIEEYLTDHNFMSILADPNRVFNGDETNFLLCPKTTMVLATTGARNVYEVDRATARVSYWYK